MRLEQKLHRCPFDALLPHEVDQVDQQRDEDEKESPGQKWKKELHGLILDLRFWILD